MARQSMALQVFTDMLCFLFIYFFFVIINAISMKLYLPKKDRLVVLSLVRAAETTEQCDARLETARERQA